MATKILSLVTEETQKKIVEKTPSQYIKKRKGRGGKFFDYVETGYIISKLNDTFNYLWDFEIVDKQIGKTQIYVQGKLTVYLSPELRITKTQYGGQAIAIGQNGQPVDIGDDLKAASSDALKKCASLFGIAQDVYWPNGSETEGVESTKESLYEQAKKNPDEYADPIDNSTKEDEKQFYEDNPEDAEEKPATNAFCKHHNIEMERKFSQAKNKYYSVHWNENAKPCFGYGFQE